MTPMHCQHIQHCSARRLVKASQMSVWSLCEYPHKIKRICRSLFVSIISTFTFAHIKVVQHWKPLSKALKATFEIWSYSKFHCFLGKLFSYSLLDFLKLTWPHSPAHWKCYLENLLIQDPGAEHGNAVGVDGSVVTPEETFGDLLLTVYNDGDCLLLHTNGHTVPPGEGRNKDGEK